MTVLARGVLEKLEARAGDPVRYAMPVGEARVDLDARLGERLAVRATGRIRCLACGAATRKSYGQGHCYRCFKTLARCDLCVMSPDRCHFAAGTCREPAWGEAHCMQPHVVYLANASGLKVGITRAGQIPTRWLDQGAVQALEVLHTATRRHAGLLEKALAATVSDRTDWRRMLRGDPAPLDLPVLAEDLLAREQAFLAAADDAEGGARARPPGAAPRAFRYPVLDYPTRVTSINLERTPEAEGTLLGIKGQYLILDTGVLNVRRHSGFEVEVRG